MQVIDAALIVAGKDKIADLFAFVQERQKVADQEDSFVDWLMYTRIMVELSLAITAYAGNKEK